MYGPNSNQIHLSVLIRVFKIIRKSQVGECDQGWRLALRGKIWGTLYGRGHQVRSWRAGVPAEFSSNPNQTHLSMLIIVFKIIRKSQVGECDQGWRWTPADWKIWGTLYGRGHQVRSWRAGVPAEFSSNPDQTHLKQLIKVVCILETSRQVCWGKLELNSAGHRPSRNKFKDPCCMTLVSNSNSWRATALQSLAPALIITFFIEV